MKDHRNFKGPSQMSTSIPKTFHQVIVIQSRRDLTLFTEISYISRCNLQYTSIDCSTCEEKLVEL